MSSHELIKQDKKTLHHLNIVLPDIQGDLLYTGQSNENVGEYVICSVPL